MLSKKCEVQGLLGSEGNFIRLLYNLDFTASNQNMPFKIIEASFRAWGRDFEPLEI